MHACCVYAVMIAADTPAVFAVTAVVLCVGIITGIVPVPTAEVTNTVTTTTVVETAYTSDVHNTTTTALSILTNTTYIPPTTYHTEFTLADGTYDGQLKTLVARQPNNVRVDTSSGDLRLEANYDGMEHSVTLEWDDATDRWEVHSASPSAPTWFGNGVDQSIEHPNYILSFCVNADASVLIASRPTASMFHVYARGENGTYSLTENVTFTLGTLYGQCACSSDGRYVIFTDQTYNTNVGLATVLYSDTPGVGYSAIQEITPDNATGSSTYGRTIDMSSDGSVVVIGGPADSTNQGAVWAYQLNASNVYELVSPKFFPTTVISGPTFGYCIGLTSSGNRMVVGARIETFSGNALHGAAWIYDRDESTGLWTETYGPIFGSPNTGSIGNVRYCDISGSGDTVIVYGNSGTSDFVRTLDRGADGSYSQVTADLVGGDEFGYFMKLSCSGDTLVVSEVGAGYVYTRDRSTNAWRKMHTAPYDSSSDDSVPGHFSGVSCDGRTVIFMGDLAKDINVVT